MVKVRKVGSRGTKSYVKDEGSQNWAGDSYRKIEQDKMMKTPKGETMHLGLGVRTTKAGNLPEPNDIL